MQKGTTVELCDLLQNESSNIVSWRWKEINNKRRNQSDYNWSLIFSYDSFKHKLSWIFTEQTDFIQKKKSKENLTMHFSENGLDILIRPIVQISLTA